jgi:hypothetical protein
MDHPVIGFGVLLFLVVILSFSIFFNFSYSFGGDQGIPVYTVGSIFKLGFFMWNPLIYSGIINEIYSAPLLIFYLFISFIYSVLGIKFAFLLYYSLLGWFGAFGLFILLNELFKKQRSLILKSLFFIISILFILNFGLSLGDLTLETSMVFLPYIVFFSYKIAINATSLSNGNKQARPLYLYTSLLALFLSLAILFGFGDVIQTGIFVVILFVFLTIFSGANKYLKFRYYFYAFLAAILISLPMVVSTFLSLYRDGLTNSIFNSVSYSILATSTLNIIQSLTGFVIYPMNWAQSLIGLLFLLISIIGTVIVINYKNKILKVLFVGMWTEYIITLFLSATINKPFGPAFSFILGRFNLLLSLRYPSALKPVFTFLIFVLFGMAIFVIYKQLQNKKKTYMYLFLMSVLILIGAYLYQFVYMPYMQYYGQPTQSEKLFNVQSIPPYVSNLSNFINNKHGNYSIATLPLISGWQFTNWYVGVNVYSLLINRPTYTGGFSGYSEFFFPTSDSEYHIISQIIDTNASSLPNISNLLGVFGIKYIIVQGDAVEYSQCGGCVPSIFSFNAIYKNLNSTSNIAFLKYFNTTALYQNLNYVPLVYASNIDNSENASYKGLLNIIGNETFNIQDTVVCSAQNIGLFNNTNKINPTGISNFKQPHVLFVQNSPTKVTAHITNATTPYYLVFRETYDPHWAAFYSNGTEINQSRHIQVNGFANAWYMNKTGNYTITLYYTLQTYAWISWAISLIALGATVSIGVYGWKASKAHSKHIHKPVRA